MGLDFLGGEDSSMDEGLGWWIAREHRVPVMYLHTNASICKHRPVRIAQRLSNLL